VSLSNGRPRLSWNASTDNVGVTGYAIYRSTNGTLGAQVAKVTTRTWTDPSVVEGTTYTYAVRAYDAANNLSGATALISIKAFQAPTAPTSLTATLSAGDPVLKTPEMLHIYCQPAIASCAKFTNRTAPFSSVCALTLSRALRLRSAKSFCEISAASRIASKSANVIPNLVFR